MARISCKRHRLPATVIQHAGWPYFRFTLSLRDVEEMLAQRSIDASCGTIRAWTLKSVPKIAADLRRRKQPPSPRGCHDEMVCRIGGEQVFLWRAVDDESEVPDPVVQKRRDTRDALKPLKQLLRSQPADLKSSSLTGLYRIAQRFVRPAGKGSIVPVACVRMTVPEKRICRSGGASERCSGSNHKAPRSNF